MAGGKDKSQGEDAKKASAKFLKDGGSEQDVVFTLEARKEGKGANDKIICTIKEVEEKTFKLVVEWSEPLQEGISLNNLEKELPGVDFLIKVSKPEGGKYALPEPIKDFKLSGGTDPQPALPASAIFMANT